MTLQARMQTTLATTRSQFILETVSELVAPHQFWQRQVLVKLRHPGDEGWTFTFAASDSAATIHEVVPREVDIAIINPAAC